MRDLGKTFNLHQSLSIDLFHSNLHKRVFTIGGQNNWPFSGCHESLDGCEETDIIIEYDINLREGTGCRWVNSDQTWVTCTLISTDLHVFHIFTSSNRMSDVAVFSFCGTVWSEPDDMQLDGLQSGFSDGKRPSKYK